MDPVAYAVRVVPRDGPVQETPVVGHSGWAVRSLELREAVDEPFWLELTMVAHDLTLDVEGLVGGAATASMDGTDVERHLSGVVVSAVYLGTFDGAIHLRMLIQPALALGGLTERSRVFQALTVPEIVVDVAGEHMAGGSVDISHLRAEQLAPRTNCVLFF